MKKNNNNNNQKFEAGNFPLKTQPIVLGIVLRDTPSKLQKLFDFLETTEISVIYKKTSYGKLYIASNKGDGDFE